MRFTSLLLLLGGIALSHAIIIGRDAPDGIYTGDINNHTAPALRIRDLPDIPVLARSGRPGRLSQREVVAKPLPVNTETTCTGKTLDAADFEAVQKLFFERQCYGNEMQGKAIFAIKKNNVVLFWCSYASMVGVQGCKSEEFSAANRLWDYKCGDNGKNRYRSGYVWVNDWAKVYGRDTADAPICNTNGASPNIEDVNTWPTPI